MLRLIAYRLYLTAQVLLTLLCVAFVAWFVVVEAHDRWVAASDFQCLDKAKLKNIPSRLPPGFGPTEPAKGSRVLTRDEASVLGPMPIS